MFEATRMIFLYVETPLHVGSGRGLGAVDLPIQRERTTNYPMIQASSLKGRLRAASDPNLNPQSPLTKGEHLAIFGPETVNAADHAGALSVGDARLLLFPVRSLAGVFAWTTSLDALQRFSRLAEIARLKFSIDLPSQQPTQNTAWVNGDALCAGNFVVLEDYSFDPDQSHAKQIQAIGEWLAQNALPQTAEYRYWREQLPLKLCLLPEDAWRDFVLFSTEVQTHIKLDVETKTVSSGALWTTEALPADSLLYCPLFATKARDGKSGLSAEAILTKIENLQLGRTQLGGDETTGQGIVALRLATGGAA